MKAASMEHAENRVQWAAYSVCKPWKEEDTVGCMLRVWSMQRTGYSWLNAASVKHAENRVQLAAGCVYGACREQGTVG
jgi:hypothetical protein